MAFEQNITVSESSGAPQPAVTSVGGMFSTPSITETFSPAGYAPKPSKAAPAATAASKEAPETTKTADGAKPAPAVEAPKTPAKVEGEQHGVEHYREVDRLRRIQRQTARDTAENRKLAAEAQKLTEARAMFKSGDMAGIANLLGAASATDFITEANRMVLGMKTEVQETPEQAAERKDKGYRDALDAATKRQDELQAQIESEKNERMRIDFIRSNVTPIISASPDAYPLVLEADRGEVEAAVFDAILDHFVETCSAPGAGDGEKLDPRKVLEDWESNLEAAEEARMARLRGSKRLGERLGLTPREQAAIAAVEAPAAAEKTEAGSATEAAKAEGNAIAELSEGARLRAKKTPQRRLPGSQQSSGTPPRPKSWLSMTRAERLRAAGWT